MIAELSQRIAGSTASSSPRFATRHPVAPRLQQPAGVGPLTALAYVLLSRIRSGFGRSRDVGAYFGLVPRLDESSDSRPQLRISKAGDAFGRRLLVSAAHYILGPFGPPCDLRRYGEALAAAGREECEEARGGRRGAEIGGAAPPVVGQRDRYDPDYLATRSRALPNGGVPSRHA